MSYVYNNSVNDPIYAGDYAETVVAPTYTEQGYTLHLCPCGDSYKDNYTDATGHKWDGGTMIKVPTYDEPGIIRYNCTK